MLHNLLSMQQHIQIFDGTIDRLLLSNKHYIHANLARFSLAKTLCLRNIF